MKYVVTGTIGERTSFPTDRFKGFCYESWGNAWSMIDGIEAEYIPYYEILDSPEIIDDIDIINFAWDLEEVIDLAKGKCFIIITEHGSGLNFDQIENMEDKLSFKKRIDDVDLLLATTYGGCEYWKLFTDTPVLNIPLPIDLEVFSPRSVNKFDEFTVSIGEVIPGSGADRPLQYQSITMLNKIGAKIATTLNPNNDLTEEQVISACRIDKDSISFYPHGDFLSMSNSYLPKSHASMMISTLPTFGRLAYVSAAIGVPCVGSFYQMHREICPELAFTYNEIPQMMNAVERLRDDKYFYNQCVKDSLCNIKKMSESNIARRICTEILPLITKKPNKYKYMKWTNGSDFDKKVIEEGL